jgi:hypothetical protein
MAIGKERLCHVCMYVCMGICSEYLIDFMEI